jgi:linearmycin/streptolysin S transport system ATP-binding protein
MEPMRLLQVENLRKSYGDLLAVDGISFSVESGRVFGLLGPNGAGKSTTMMILSGALDADAGSATLDGAPFQPRQTQARRVLGVVPQDLAIYLNLTARENLTFFGSLHGLPRRELQERIDDVLGRIGLEGRADDLAETFSGGMKRRLNFGVALLHRPQLLILDEPTVGVDPQSRTHLLRCVTDLADEGVAVIYASHYMEEVQAISQRVAIMDHGHILVNDTLEDLLRATHAGTDVRVAQWNSDVGADLQDLVEVVAANNGDAQLRLRVAAGGSERDLTQSLTRLFDSLQQRRVVVRSVETHEANLEQLFLDLTGRQLRD